MNIRSIINDYTECNNFEVRILNNKIKIFYYDNIDHFSDNKLVISAKKKKIIIEGSNIIIETMFKEYLIISGMIKNIILKDLFEDNNE